MRGKLDAFSAKVDSIDLSYDRRISELEMQRTRLDEQIQRSVEKAFPKMLDSLWSEKIEQRVKFLIDRDSAELKQMVREDLKRLESLMLSSFDPSKSSHNSTEEVTHLNRRSLTELPSLRNSLESA